MLRKILKKYITMFTLVSLIIPSTLLNLVNLEKAHAANLGEVVINEMMVNSSQEWIELYNNTSTTVDVTGWYFTSIDYTGSLYTISAPTSIAPNGFLKLNLAGSKLRNDVDDVTLMGFDNDGFITTMDQITYGPNPWTQIVSAPSVDKTIGRVDDGSGCWFSNLIASPNSSNQVANPNRPVSINSLNIKATTNNPVNYINNTTKTAVKVETELSSYQTSTLTAYLVDESGSKVNDTITATADQTHQEFTLNTDTPITLVDGTVVPWIKVTDTATGISTEYLEGTYGQKDIISPDAPTATSVTGNIINIANKTNVTATVALNANSLSTDNVTFEIGNLAFNQTALDGAGTLTFSGLDLQTLTDGNVAISAFATDEARNKSLVTTGTPGTKDTVAPTSDTTMSNSTYGPFTWPDKISGTASDATSGVNTVVISVKRSSDNKYYNGSDWQASETFVNTSYLTGVWQYLFSSNLLENGVTYTITSKATDATGNTQLTLTPKTFVYDTSTPAGSFTINDDVTYTTSQTVNLKMTASVDATFMRFSNDNITWSSWEAFAATKTWALPANDGNKTVYVQFKNNAGNTSAVSSKIITLDTTTPTGTILINNNDIYTKTKNVTLTLSATDLTAGMDKMKFSNDGTTWSNWESYNTTKTWDLLSTTYSTTSDGLKTVYAKFKDKAGNETSVTISDTITYDATAPTNGTLSIDSGATVTSLGTVTLTLSATDATSGMDKMKFSNDNTTWSTAETYATTKIAWALTNGDGVKTIYVKFLDKTGNETLAISKNITKDTTGPVGTISINNSANYTKSRLVTLNLTATDLSNITSMAFSDNGTDFTTWETYNTTKSYTLPEGDGSKTVYAKFKDQLGYVSLIVSDSIILDTTTPSDPTMNESPNGQSLTKGDEIKLSGTAEAGSLITIRIYSDAVYTEYVYANTNGTWSHTISSNVINNLASGDHKITLTITDLAGNVTSEKQIAAFTLKDKVAETVATTQASQIVTKIEKDETGGETEVTTVGPENGNTKGDDTDKTKTTRTLVTLAILIIAIGAIAGGYYGYEWWMQKENTNKKKAVVNTKKTKKPEKFGRW